MQTISVPYRVDEDGAELVRERRRIYSCAVRLAYSNAVDGHGRALRQKDLRDHVKNRLAGQTTVDAWTLHCATLEGMDLRRARPDGRIVFGGRKDLQRRQDGLISNEEWRELRLRPLCTRGDKTYAGNRHFRLSPDARTCPFVVYGKAVMLDLPEMRGNAGEVLRQAAALAAAKQINVTFRIDATHLHVTVDPDDLPDHPERRRPVAALPGRAVGIDLNPNWVGIAAVANAGDATSLDDTRVLDHALVELGHAPGASNETVREALAAVCDRAIGMARKHEAGVLVLEKGLGKLRSGGKNRRLNRLLNYWARTVFAAMLRRKAGLAGLRVAEVWGGYSTTVGNVAFELPDACASACEIGRRGLAAAAGQKELLPAFATEVVSRRWKDGNCPAKVLADLRRARTWGELHRGLKAAKLGVRRPHPACPPDPGVQGGGALLLPSGLAVRRLGLRHRPGRIYRPVPTADGDARRRAATMLPKGSATANAA